MVILIDHPGDDGFPADGSKVGHVPDGLRFHVRGPLLPGLMRPVAVVMDHVLAEHEGQVALTENQDPVEQLAAEVPLTRSQMAFIRGRLRQGSDNPQSLGPEHLTERGGEHRIAIMNQNRNVPRRSPNPWRGCGPAAPPTPRSGVRSPRSRAARGCRAR